MFSRDVLKIDAAAVAETIQAHNTFDDPEHVRPVVFEGARLEGERLLATLPPRSVTVLELV